MSDEYEADFEDDIRSSQLFDSLSRHTPHHVQHAIPSSHGHHATLPLPPLLPSDEPFTISSSSSHAAAAGGHIVATADVNQRTPNVRQSRDMLSVLDLAQTPVTGLCTYLSFFMRMDVCHNGVNR